MLKKVISFSAFYKDSYKKILINEQWSFLMSSFNIRGVPTYFIVDPEGNITFKQTGFPGVDTMKKELMKALNK